MDDIEIKQTQNGQSSKKEIKPDFSEQDKLLFSTEDECSRDFTPESIKDAIAVDKKAAMRMMITGTPAVYIDGEWDKMRDGYKDLID